jgi:hypothetical protein
MGEDNSISGPAVVVPGKWHRLAARFDGRQFQLYSDGIQVASGEVGLRSVSLFPETGPFVSPAPLSTGKWLHVEAVSLG